MGYRLVPSATGGTDVTEWFEIVPILPERLYWALLGRWRGRTNRRGMRATLDRIKADAEGRAGH